VTAGRPQLPIARLGEGHRRMALLFALGVVWATSQGLVPAGRLPVAGAGAVDTAGRKALSRPRAGAALGGRARRRVRIAR
jgi:hypothetical protein